jgi:hypothetical protein
VLFAPLICCLTLWTWHQLQLPEHQGPAGQRIHRLLKSSLWISALEAWDICRLYMALMVDVNG